MQQYVKHKFFGVFAMFLLCMALPSLASAWVTIKGDGDRWFKADEYGDTAGGMDYMWRY